MQMRLIAAIAALAIAFASAWVIQGWRYTGEIAQIRAEHADAYAKAQAQARSEETRRAAAIEGIRRDAQIRIEELEADAATAVSAAGSLREELAKRTRRATANPGTANGGAAALSALVLYSELLDRADTRAGELAGEADRRRVAGLACQHAYDSLR